MLTTVWIGGIEVVSLLDGVGDLDDPDILDPRYGPSDEVWDPYRTLYPAVFAAHGGWRLHVRATLLRAHGRTVLVDTGVGGPTSPAMSWYPAPGQLMESLAESGTAPGDVDVVVITHVHDDHIGGTVTAEGAPAFPNARYLINRIDLDWQEVAPGIRTRHLPGHTPGHQAVHVGDGGASLLLPGDAINHPAQLQEPELASGPDDDPEAARTVRRMLIDELLDSDRVMAPPHFGEPFGRVVSDGPVGRISWVPIA